MKKGRKVIHLPASSFFKLSRPELTAARRLVALVSRVIASLKSQTEILSVQIAIA